MHKCMNDVIWCEQNATRNSNFSLKWTTITNEAGETIRGQKMHVL